MKKYLFLMGIVFSVASISCKKEHSNAAGTVTLNFENVVDGIHADVSGLTHYINDHGDDFTITKLKYMVSNVALKKKDGTWYVVPESYYLINEADSNSLVCALENIPGGQYSSVRFLVGVDSARNVSGAQTGALDVTNDMYWGWTSGYIFFKMEGDYSGGSGGTYEYHIGGFSGVNSALRTIEKDFGGNYLTVDGDREAEIHLTAELQEVFMSPNQINIPATPAVTMPGPAASNIANNYADMFTFEHLHN